jgi:hypothetical protein
MFNQRRNAMRQLVAIFVVTILSPVLAPAQQFGFTDRAQAFGVSNSNANNYGVAFGDFDNDGWDDIYISVMVGVNRLFRNNGNGTFTNVAAAAGVAVTGYCQTAAWGDIDNDGRLDLYVGTAKGQSNRLFRNLGNGAFEDVTAKSGTGNMSRTQSAIFADFDRDGWLDIYLSNFLPEKNALYRNNHDGTFTDIAAASNADENTYAMAAVPGDYDNDGDVDLLLSHDNNVPYTLLRNDGAGRFENVAAAAGVAYADQAMGADFGDYDNDGWLDLYVTNLYGNVLYRNRGNGTFENVAAKAGVGDKGMAWSTFFADGDLDGWLDLYVVKQSNYSTPPLPNVFYHNQANGAFRVQFANTPLASYASGVGGACSDVNNDGAPDFFVANSGKNELFVNDGPLHAWLKVRLVGVASNRSAIGARLRLLADGKWQTRHVTGGTGFASQNSLTQIFGLGNAEAADSLVIYWPSGMVERLGAIAGRKTVAIREGQGVITGVKANTTLALPTNWSLQQNFPNPISLSAQPTTAFILEAPRPAAVEVAVFNVLGQKVVELANGHLNTGKHVLQWNGRNEKGIPVTPGIYFVRLRTNELQQTQKIVAVK